MKLNKQDKKLINLLSIGLPLSPTPFMELAKEIGLTEQEIINKVTQYKDNGLIRRFGATLHHKKTGFTSNAMSVWAVPNNLVGNVANEMISRKEITHCYEREICKEWPYNMYAVIHGRTKEECTKIAFDISQKTGISKYKLLYSTQEFKKTSMVYFRQDLPS